MTKLSTKEETIILELLENRLIQLLESKTFAFGGNEEQANDYRNELIKEHFTIYSARKPLTLVIGGIADLFSLQIY